MKVQVDGRHSSSKFRVILYLRKKNLPRAFSAVPAAASLTPQPACRRCWKTKGAGGGLCLSICKTTEVAVREARSSLSWGPALCHRGVAVIAPILCRTKLMTAASNTQKAAHTLLTRSRPRRRPSTPTVRGRVLRSGFRAGRRVSGAIALKNSINTLQFATAAPARPY